MLIFQSMCVMPLMLLLQKTTVAAYIPCHIHIHVFFNELKEPTTPSYLQYYKFHVILLGRTTI
jgi:hypothetical protein